MKIVHISDTHMRHKSMVLPDGDVLVHSGDATHVGSHSQMTDFSEWFNALEYEHKIIIPGNHELVTDRFDIFDAYFDLDVHVLVNREVVINGIKFYGQPYTPAFGEWGWMYPRNGDEARKIWAEVPDDTDVVVCHGPPLMYGDVTFDYVAWQRTRKVQHVHAGCNVQLKRLQQVKPSLVLCGHIHGSYGVWPTEFGTTVVNSAHVADQGSTNPPHVLHI